MKSASDRLSDGEEYVHQIVAAYHVAKAVLVHSSRESTVATGTAVGPTTSLNLCWLTVNYYNASVFGRSQTGELKEV